MINKSILIVLTTTILINTGCAAMFTGTTNNINVTSTPSGADCDVSGHGVHTPGNVVIAKSSNNLSVVCQKEGYETGTSGAESTFNTVSLVNILTGYGLVIGFIIDFATGAAWEYPSHVNVNLPAKTKS